MISTSNFNAVLFVHVLTQRMHNLHNNVNDDHPCPEINIKKNQKC
jgi:hypothetical protein